MSDLKSFVVLQARLFEFLSQQDETTLQAIARGDLRLAVLRADDTLAPVSSAPLRAAGGPSPEQAARDLSMLVMEDERREYLLGIGLNRDALRKVAKLLGLVRYSSLNPSELIDLLAGHDPGQAVSDRPRTAKPRLAATRQAQPLAETAPPRADVAAIAARLRETETEEEGAEYLRAQQLDQPSLLAVAAELQLTRVSRLGPTELEKRVLKQAIGARRKFAGLRSW